MWKVGIASYSYHRSIAEGKLDIWGFLKRASILGVEAVEIDPFWGREIPPRESDGYLKHLKEELTLLRLLPVVKANPLGSGPLVLKGKAGQDILSKFRERLEVTQRIGGRVVRIVSRLDPYSASRENQIKILYRNLEKLCKDAEELGLTLALENHGDLRVREIKRILEKVGVPYLRLTLDVANNLILGEEPLEVIRELLPWAVSVHFKNYRAKWYPAGFRISCSLPQGGIIDLEEVVYILKGKDRNTECFLFVESHVEEDLDEDETVRAYLNFIRSRF